MYATVLSQQHWIRYSSITAGVVLQLLKCYSWCSVTAGVVEYMM